jgi:uroporphyrinogen decarboxylase
LRIGRLRNVLSGAVQSPPPVWLMRQAGRYLPEYREARGKAGSFWNLCMTPQLAAEVTLQPIDRFNLDAAIVFSDILLVPYALGSRVTFEEGVGPRLDRTESSAGLCRDVDEWHRKMAPVYEALRLCDSRLEAGKDLIGFAGAPWTLATYMAAGQGSTDQRRAKLWGYRDPDGFAEFLRVIASCVAEHLCAQIRAGASVVQIFDSWAGGLPEQVFDDWVIAPTRFVVERVRERHPDAQIIGFPRAATSQAYERFARDTGVDGVSCDTAVAMRWAAGTFGSRVALQGNLDPIALVAGGATMNNAIDRLLDDTEDTPFIANLGHGVVPETPVENVAAFVERVRRRH